MGKRKTHVESSFDFTFHPYISLQSRAKFSMVTNSVLNFPLFLTVEKNYPIKNIIAIVYFCLQLYGAGVFFIVLKLVELKINSACYPSLIFIKHVAEKKSMI